MFAEEPDLEAITTLRRSSDLSSDVETLRREMAASELAASADGAPDGAPGKVTAPGGFKSVKRANPIYQSEHAIPDVVAAQPEAN